MLCTVDEAIYLVLGPPPTARNAKIRQSRIINSLPSVPRPLNSLGVEGGDRGGQGEFEGWGSPGVEAAEHERSRYGLHQSVLFRVDHFTLEFRIQTFRSARDDYAPSRSPSF